MSSIYHSMDAPFSPAEQKIDKLKPAEKAFFVLDDLCAMTLNSRSVASSVGPLRCCAVVLQAAGHEDHPALLHPSRDLRPVPLRLAHVGAPLRPEPVLVHGAVA